MNIQNDSLKTGVMYVIAVCMDIALSCAERQFFCAINKFPNFAELYDLRNALEGLIYKGVYSG